MITTALNRYHTHGWAAHAGHVLTRRQPRYWLNYFSLPVDALRC